MFTEFFYTLRREGIPVSLTEWMTLMEALSQGLAFSSLTGFYHMARSILVKTETHYDRYDRAFLQYFKGIETTEAISQQVWEWLNNPIAPLQLSDAERQRLEQQLHGLDLKEMERLFAERLKEQTEAHHGGSKWIGTGGTSPFGHSGYHPTGIRVGGQSHGRSALKVAAERQFEAYRDDETIGVRQFEVALRKLRQLSTRWEGPKDELDLEGTIDSTCRNAGYLQLEWTRPRQNTLKVLLLMDVGGSMIPHAQLCNRLFTAAHRASHFKSLEFYYFHNCVYDQIYLDPSCHPAKAISTTQLLQNHNSEHKLILVGDACMAPSELTRPDGIIFWGMTNEEPGLTWLQRLSNHFPYSMWLNPIPSQDWDNTYGSPTLKAVGQVYPMFDLTMAGLEQGIRKLMQRH